MVIYRHRVEEVKKMVVEETCNGMEGICRHKEVVVMERVEVEIYNNMEVTCDSRVDLLADMVVVGGVDSS